MVGSLAIFTSYIGASNLQLLQWRLHNECRGAIIRHCIGWF